MEFILGIFGVAIGAAIQFGFNIWQQELKNRDKKVLDEKRRRLLKEALDHPPKGTEWRKLTTLCGLIGAEPNETTRLLIELGARGSETNNGTWALLSDKPLGEIGL